MTFLAILSLVPIFHFPIPGSRFSYHPEIKLFKCTTPPSKTSWILIGYAFSRNLKSMARTLPNENGNAIWSLTQVLFKATTVEPTLTVTSLQRPFFWADSPHIDSCLKLSTRDTFASPQGGCCGQVQLYEKNYKILLLYTVHIETN